MNNLMESASRLKTKLIKNCFIFPKKCLIFPLEILFFLYRRVKQFLDLKLRTDKERKNERSILFKQKERLLTIAQDQAVHKV